jgi:dihydroorotate dehydrogenase electron transfer subunit
VRQEVVAVSGRTDLAPGTFILRLRAPWLAQSARPGQFLHVRVSATPDPLLRRPISLLRVGKPGEERGGLAPDEVALLIQVVGRGTALLERLRPGDQLDVMGPLGRPFTLDPSARHLLMVAGGIGVAPLVMLADEALASGQAVTLAMGARGAAGVFPAGLLPEEVEYVVATEDGALGKRGLVTDLLPPLLTWADQVYACGPLAMIRALARLPELTAAKRTQVSLEEHMGCAVGVCYGCVVETRHGRKRVCSEGPVFALSELEL